jgi:CBS domain-containing protein
MYVHDLMHTAVTTVPPDARVRTAYQMMTMRNARIRHLPVVTDNGTLMGILTDRDVRRAGASDAPPMATHELHYLLDKLSVRDIMTPNVVTVRGDTPIEEAGQLFLQRKFGCLPVVRDGHCLEGILTVVDLLQAYIAHADTEHPLGVTSMMQTQLLTATPSMALAEVERLMHANNIRHVPVISGTHLVGIVTDRDIRDALPSPATTLSRGEIAYQMATTPVKACMTTAVVSISAEAAMVYAARLLVQHTIGCLPVMANHALVGIVTDMDCVRAFLAMLSGDVKEH